MYHKPSLDERTSGVLLHPTSLPGEGGSGDVGKQAYHFADFLAASGQSWWQMLPIGPVDGSGSPYNSYSAFAGSDLLISLEDLCAQKLLSRADLEAVKLPQGIVKRSVKRVFYDKVGARRRELLGIAFERFQKNLNRNQKLSKQYSAFCREEAHWLEDYVLFCALKDVHDQEPWWTWERELVTRRAKALAEAKEAYAERIAYHTFIQFVFHEQWMKLKVYCNKKGVGLIGDIPIFVAHDSSDVWAHTDLFDLDKDRLPREVSGAAPDAFSDEGQLWGHPLYKWGKHKKTGYAWWIDRFRQTFKIFDAVRIDHFLGFARYWSVQYSAKTARHGKWKKGPGEDLFVALRDAIGEMPIIAEDLGILTPQAARLRDQFGFPGMRVLQFAYGEDDSYHAAHQHSKQCVVYTGTHDNDTTKGWWKEICRKHRADKKAMKLKSEKIAKRRRVSVSSLNGEAKWLTEKERTLVCLGGGGEEIHWDMIRAGMGSRANLAVFPAQDLLGLDEKSRMNVPGTIENNWCWRLESGALDQEVAHRLGELTKIHGRSSGS
ncbi:4-alpha-glucanotransferase [Poriferisphaera sp. WC338]|uniref:4-alpha-glucanotransferase n=1 Tax=Poriferisphaera sp. WC338 TaxID=3425129 RepID=UPI003D81A19B